MDKELKKALLTAIGAASIVREKIEGIAKEAVSGNLISRKDATQLVRGILQKAESESERLGRILKKHVASVRETVEKRGTKIVKKALKKAHKRGKKIIRKITR